MTTLTTLIAIAIVTFIILAGMVALSNKIHGNPNKQLTNDAVGTGTLYGKRSASNPDLHKYDNA